MHGLILLYKYGTERADFSEIWQLMSWYIDHGLTALFGEAHFLDREWTVDRAIIFEVSLKERNSTGIVCFFKSAKLCELKLSGFIHLCRIFTGRSFLMFLWYIFQCFICNYT